MKQTMTLAGILLAITLSLASCNFNGNSNNSKKANINNADRNTDKNIPTIYCIFATRTEKRRARKQNVTI